MDNETQTIDSKSKEDFFKSLFTERNRGILLDIIIFLLNLLLMRYLTRGFVEIIQWANVGDFVAQSAIFFIFVAVFILPPTGSILKRWRFHERFRSAGVESPDYEDVMGGCLFNPIMFFCLNVVIFSAINAFIFQFLIGDSFEKHGGLFVGSLLLGIVLIILQTWIVYRYFSPPKEAPGSFLRSPMAENLGDVCFYLNMILFQLFWNFVTMVPFNRVSGIGDFLARLFFLGFIALLIYFPPRIFYLAEDLKRPRAWLTMLLANAPVMFRILIGTNSDANW
jgi:hypothetical protein